MMKENVHQIERICSIESLIEIHEGIILSFQNIPQTYKINPVKLSISFVYINFSNEKRMLKKRLCFYLFDMSYEHTHTELMKKIIKFQQQLDMTPTWTDTICVRKFNVRFKRN